MAVTIEYDEDDRQLMVRTQWPVDEDDLREALPVHNILTYYEWVPGVYHIQFDPDVPPEAVGAFADDFEKALENAADSLRPGPLRWIPISIAAPMDCPILVTDADFEQVEVNNGEPNPDWAEYWMHILPVREARL
jgi:hypothetical protein